MSNKWKLPEPVFRSSTGELVRPDDVDPIDLFDPEPDTLKPSTPGDDDDIALELPDDPLAKLYAPPEGKSPSEAAVATAPAHVPAVAIEPQPFISEEFTAERVLVERPTTKPAKASRPIFAALVVFVLAAVAIGFVAFVYFLFFNGRSDTGGF